MTTPEAGEDMAHAHCYSSPMTTPEPDPRTDVRAMLALAGINVTDEGMAQFRERRLAAMARHTPELQAAWREQAGLPPVVE
jgi:hypothetical protein